MVCFGLSGASLYLKVGGQTARDGQAQIEGRIRKCDWIYIKEPSEDFLIHLIRNIITG